MAVRGSRAWRAMGVVLAVLELLVATGAAALAWWLPSEEELARRAEERLGQAFGVPVRIGALHWQLLPKPMVELRDVASGHEPPATVARLALWPQLRPLLQRRIALDRLEIEGARLPMAAPAALGGMGTGANGEGGRWTAAERPLSHLELTDVDLVNARGIALRWSGTVDFDAGWRPRHAELQRVDVHPPARLILQRQGAEDRWHADVDIASGTWNGDVALQGAQAGGIMQLSGSFAPTNIDLQQLVAALERKAVVAGRMSGRTDIDAQGADAGALLASLHTRTRFSVAPATVLNFSLDEAIKTAGTSHRGGNTPLDSLTGQLDTSNGSSGMVLRYTNLKATSGALTASGSATLANRQIDATLSVDLIDGVAGVPLRITGDVAKPTISVPPGAVVGAVVGTAILPGVGTAIGARIGSFFGHLFGMDGSDDAAAAARPPARPPRSATR